MLRLHCGTSENTFLVSGLHLTETLSGRPGDPRGSRALLLPHCEVVSMAGRRCPGRDEVAGRTRACPTILTDSRRYCSRHAKAYESKRGTRQARGYDSQHDTMRAAWQRRIDGGEHVTCATCPTTITGRMWQLGHDHVNGGYLGPQCVPCNTADGGRRGATASNRARW